MSQFVIMFTFWRIYYIIIPLCQPDDMFIFLSFHTVSLEFINDLPRCFLPHSAKLFVDVVVGWQLCWREKCLFSRLDSYLNQNNIPFSQFTCRILKKNFRSTHKFARAGEWQSRAWLQIRKRPHTQQGLKKNWLGMTRKAFGVRTQQIGTCAKQNTSAEEYAENDKKHRPL